MERYELYLDRNNILSLNIFKNETNEYESNALKGNDAYLFLSKKLSSLNVLNMEEINDNIKLQYKNFILNINEYEFLFEKHKISVIFDAIRKYYQNEKLKEVKKVKLQKENKYTKKRIIASSLCVLFFAGMFAIIVKGKNLSLPAEPDSSYTPEIKNLPADESIISLPESNEVISKENNLSPFVTEEGVIEEDNVICIDCEDRTSTEKAVSAETNYKDLIDKYSKMYGVDSNLMLAIATQERGKHSEIMDYGGATGIMQIQNSVWENQFISAYNYETKKQEKFCITKDDISDLECNIKLGCMIFQNNLNLMKNNVFAAIQCYNMGYGNMHKIFNQYCIDNNKEKDEVLNSINDLSWLEYRNLISVGDNKYIENVLSYLKSDNINVNCLNGENYTVCIDKQQQSKNIIH